MTLGAGTLNAAESDSNRLFADVVSFAGDDAYPTGGTVDFDAYLQALVGDSRNVMGVIAVADSGDNIPMYVGGNLMVKLRSTGAEVANTTDLSGVTFTLLVLSK